MKMKIIGAVCLFMNICVQGKRSILFFSILVIVVILIPGFRNSTEALHERRKKMLGLIVLITIAFLIMVISSLYIKTTSRGYENDSTEILYTTLRIDFFRDDRVRVAIYSLLHPEIIHILDYYGQSLLPIPLALFPLDFISGHFFHYNPYSYAVYFSAGIEMLPLSRSWTFMTPCIFAELISNFGFLGILLMPFLSLWMGNIAERYPYPMNALMIIGYIGLQIYAINYMAYLFEFILLMWFLNKYKVKVGRKISL